MFIKKEKPKLSSIFKNGKVPLLVSVTRSFDNPNWFSNAHVHNQETELLFVAGGQAVVTINQKEFCVKKGDILVIEHGCIHSVVSDPSDPSDLFSCSITDYQICDMEENHILKQPDLVPVKHAGVHEAFLESCWRELQLYQDMDDPVSVSVCNLITGSIAAVYYSLFKGQQETYHLPQHHFTYDIIIFIYGHYAEKITLERLAKEFHMSAGHISHEFSKMFGISPINYTINLRVDQAKWLLTHSGLTISEIAEEVGYQNIQHFTKIFQKRTGYLPLEYKREYQSV